MLTVHGWAFPDADVFMANELQPDGSYQRRQLETALGYVTDFSCALDGGAHVGTWTRLLNDRFARVLAVEPSPDTYEALVLNARQFEWAHVDTLNLALGATFGSVSLVLSDKDQARQNAGGRYVQPDGAIPMVPIDAWKLESLGFLKLDVEGSEYAALCGARQTLLRCQPVVLFENKTFWTRYGVAADGPQQLLRECGYHKVAQVSADEIWSATP